MFGVATIFVWLLKRQRGGELDPLEPLTVLGILLAAQGLVGAVQYELKLPGQMVWVHVVLATLTWLVSLWAVAVEGRIGEPRSVEIRVTQSLRSWPNGHRAFQRADRQRPLRRCSLSILVVDDESDLREMLTRSFSREGHQVTAVGKRTRGDRPRQQRALRHRPAGHRARPGTRRLRGLPDAACAPQRRADHHADRARLRGRRRARTRGRRRRLRHQAVRSGRAAQPYPRGAAPDRARGSMGSELLTVGPITLDRSRREVTIEASRYADVQRIRAARRADGRPGPAAQPPGAAARDLG